MFKLDARRSNSETAGLGALRMADVRPARAAKPGKGLSAAALKVTAEPTVGGYSPIVLAGIVRLIEFAVTVLVGSAIYVA